MLIAPGVDLQEKEEERERYFREIGYTEEDEYVEFPPEVGMADHTH